MYALSMSSSNKDFEYQEMKILLDAMKQKRISRSRDLDVAKSQELFNYVQQVTSYRRSDVTLTQLVLPGSVWRLAFTTEANLPRDATIYLNFQDEHTLRYSLEFGKKTLGLNRLDAVSSWSLNNSNKRISFVYDKVTMDAFGFKNVKICTFGLLNGRTNYVETAFYDGDVWIESTSDSFGSALLNVYVREVDNDAWRK